jgi:CheY-like chemotaxis protein/HPt (histidine-containing phosphotransfer) domain-containing protein
MLFARKLLKKMGFETVDEAGNGIQALEKIESVNGQYDLVLMDCQMPEMDGFEACRTLREREKSLGRKRTPVIAMTAHAMEGDRNRCLEAGMDDYLSKPVNPDKLHAVLHQWLNKNNTNAGKIADHTGLGQGLSATAASESSCIIDLEHLSLFTEGDLEQEKILADVFLTIGDDTLAILQAHLKGANTNDDWRHAAHKLKGSSAQVGANPLSVVCLEAEKMHESAVAEKEKSLLRVKAEFSSVRKFFESRQV